MKAGQVLDFVMSLVSLAAERMAARREKKRGTEHGDGGGHPATYPLDEARQKVKERRAGGK